MRVIVEQWRARIFDTKRLNVRQPAVGGSEHFVEVFCQPENMKSNMPVEIRQHERVKFFRDQTDSPHVGISSDLSVSAKVVRVRGISHTYSATVFCSSAGSLKKMDAGCKPSVSSSFGSFFIASTALTMSGLRVSRDILSDKSPGGESSVLGAFRG